MILNRNLLICLGMWSRYARMSGQAVPHGLVSRTSLATRHLPHCVNNVYRGTSVKRNRGPAGPYRRTKPRALHVRWPKGGLVSYEPGTTPTSWSLACGHNQLIDFSC